MSLTLPDGVALLAFAPTGGHGSSSEIPSTRWGLSQAGPRPTREGSRLPGAGRERASPGKETTRLGSCPRLPGWFSSPLPSVESRSERTLRSPNHSTEIARPSWPESHPALCPRKGRDAGSSVRPRNRADTRARRSLSHLCSDSSFLDVPSPEAPAYQWPPDTHFRNVFLFFGCSASDL